jgi:hypothetical protein
MSIKAYRRAWKDHLHQAKLIEEASLRAEQGQVCVSFDGNPFEGNRDNVRGTFFRVIIDDESFGQLAQAMIRADRWKALEAFADALKAFPVESLNGRTWTPKEGVTGPSP